ncbi:hypothetical protein QVD17_01195 [Tagetes erecta]|uniref:Uncharacterized protein n=1 Tax=Tagetes erecta TaxID=13708 RepID=A0AAD8LBP1_TARER|nr:hypothetical protein QVD17_01195 [Tagetes erecta]
MIFYDTENCLLEDGATKTKDRENGRWGLGVWIKRGHHPPIKILRNPQTQILCFVVNYTYIPNPKLLSRACGKRTF